MNNVEVQAVQTLGEALKLSAEFMQKRALQFHDQVIEASKKRAHREKAAKALKKEAYKPWLSKRMRGAGLGKKQDTVPGGGMKIPTKGRQPGALPMQGAGVSTPKPKVKKTGLRVAASVKVASCKKKKKGKKRMYKKYAAQLIGPGGNLAAAFARGLL